MYTRYEQNIPGLHSPRQTETTTEFDYPIGEQIPYCEYWKAVREISDGNEFAFVLGNQQLTLQDFMGEPSIFTDGESAQGIDASDWWYWDSEEQQLFI